MAIDSLGLVRKLTVNGRDDRSNASIAFPLYGSVYTRTVCTQCAADDTERKSRPNVSHRRIIAEGRCFGRAGKRPISSINSIKCGFLRALPCES